MPYREQGIFTGRSEMIMINEVLFRWVTCAWTWKVHVAPGVGMFRIPEGTRCEQCGSTALYIEAVGVST